ncbi:hypothetical protein JTE90_029227 [Oedothorax gibbosus]|uniref:Uncharacterized protein n=1 Tax=Oedothorax gibbosus TaxID=931172 RepID=A0AAV6VF78_9ARAC|nr:hypothetical protein JTE90_029227 [Oedothorax gibbosus]
MNLQRDSPMKAHRVTDIRDLPTTRRIRYKPTDSYYRRRKHPTPIIIRTVPIIPTVGREKYPTIPPQVIIHTHPPHGYAHSWIPTTARSYRRPLPNVYFTYYHYPPTSRVHRPPWHTQVITGHETPGRPTKVVYTPPMGNWCDHWSKKPPSQKTKTITCYKVKSPRDLCTSEFLTKWTAQVRECVLHRLTRRGNCVEDRPITKYCLVRLRANLIVCIRIIGDTICRSKINLLELITEKEIVVVGRLYEQTSGVSTPKKTSLPFPPEESKDTTQCVDKGDGGKINHCYPGLYEVLGSVAAKKKGKVALELHNINSTCLSRALQHCSSGSLADLKKKIEKMFGVCIIPVPGHTCKSDSMGFKSLDSPYCESSQIHKFTHHLESCVKHTYKLNEFKELEIIKKLETINNCINVRTLDCVFRKWETFQELISYICKVIRQTPNDHQCSSAFTVRNFKECSQNLISVTSALHDIKHGIDQNVMKTIKDCYKHSLKDCSTEVSEAFLNLLEALTNTAYLSDSDASSEEIEDDELLERGKRRVTLSSIKVATDGVKICEETEQENSQELLDSNTPAKDICEPLRSFENDDSKSTTYVLRKSCRGYDVVTWMDSLKKCVGDICDSIALEDPDSVTLERVLSVYRDCLQKKGQLQCRPKVQKTFKLFLTSVLDTLRVMSVKSTAKSCHDDLAIDNIATCVNHLHLYLVVKYHASVLRNEESKSLECLRKTCKHCDFEFLKSLLVTLDESINRNRDSVNDAESEYTVCEPDDPEYNRIADLCQGITRKRKPNRRIPNTNILKKSLDTESLKNYSDETPEEEEHENEDSYQPTIAYKAKETDYEADTTHKECGSHQYMKYLKTIFECQHLRMDNLIYSKGNNCDLNWSEEALKSLVQCVLEKRDMKLPCIISDQRQVEDYLKDLSIKLDANEKFKGLKCPQLNLVLKQFPQFAGVPMTHISAIFNCLKSVWPNCPSSVSVLSLPTVFVPLGINLNGIVRETHNETCISAKTSSKDRNLICSNDDTKVATQVMYDCLDRITKKIEVFIQEQGKIPWEILPFTVCVSTHTILECRLKDYEEFIEFMQDFLRQIQFRLKGFVELFEDPHDKEHGNKCLAQFSAPKLDKCLSLMFGFMQMYHSGNGTSSDYPQQCVEEIFGICGDINSFHMFLKKSMNISVNDSDGDVCIKNQQKDFALHPCTFGNFEKSLPYLTECTKEEIENDGRIKQTLLERCKNCVLKNAEEMCFYEFPELQQVVNASLSAISKCVKTFGTKDQCGSDIALKVRDQCLSNFYEYTNSIRNGAIIKAVQLSREFYHCIQTTAETCSAGATKAIFNLYSRITGIEMFSRYKKPQLSTVIPEIVV